MRWSPPFPSPPLGNIYEASRDGFLTSWDIKGCYSSPETPPALLSLHKLCPSPGDKRAFREALILCVVYKEVNM